jgi:hypothetical protein
MPLFEDREKEFEAWFMHDQELRFKITARRNGLLGMWAAERMGLAGDAAEAYAKTVVEAQFSGGDKHIVEKLVADLTAKGHAITPAQVLFELDHFAESARKQLMIE